MEQGDYLVRYLRGKGVPEQRKSRHEYLSHYGLDQAYVYVLVSGVVKASVTLREGEHFNIFYIQGPSPVSLLRDEVSSRAKSPYSVRVESEEAVYMAVPRIAFWEYVNEDTRLLAYVKDYYRASLDEALYRMRYLTMNGKVGAVGASSTICAGGSERRGAGAPRFRSISPTRTSRASAASRRARASTASSAAFASGGSCRRAGERGVSSCAIRRASSAM